MRRAHRHETEWQEFCRLAKRAGKRFLRRNIGKIIFLGLPLTGMLIGIIIGSKATAYAQSTKMNDYGRRIAYTAYTVKHGDTVWNIASDLAALNPEYNDIRQYISDIEKTNEIRDGIILPGEQIMIPYYISPSGNDINEIYDKYGMTH